MKHHPFTLFTGKDLGVEVRKLKPHFECLGADGYLQSVLEYPDDKPMRFRSMMSYNIEFDNYGRLIRFHEYYEKEDYNVDVVLDYAKLYDEFTEELVEDQIFKDFLYNALQMTW